MIAVGNENKKIKNKERWNYCHHMPMLLLLGANHRLSLFHMTKHFICINEVKQRIDQFMIVYMVNPSLNVNRAFRKKVEKFMYATFGEITQPFIKSILENIYISVLA